MATENVYQLVFDHAVQGMVLLQGETIMLVNAGFADSVGYTPDDLRDRSSEEIFNIVYPPDRALARAQFGEISRDTPLTQEYRFMRRDGQIGWWSVTVTPLTFADQPAILGTFLDITERKTTEENFQRGRQLLASTLDVLPVGVCLTDETGHYRMMNDAYCEIYEYDRDEMIGQHYRVIMPPDQVDLANAHYARLLTGDVGIPVERKRQRKDGSIIYIEAANALVRGVDGQKMVITTVRDITERKQTQAEIERLALSLSERVNELNCLYGIAQLVEQPDATLDAIVEGTLKLLPAAFQRPDTTCAQITLDDCAYATPDFCSDTRPQLSANIVAFDQSVGTLDVSLSDPASAAGQALFRDDDRVLVHAVAERLGRIVERFRSDAALKQLNAELKERNEDLDAYARMVAHDLKNPITVIMGFADLLLTDRTLSDDERIEALNLIAAHGEKMKTIVEALLLLSSVRQIDPSEIVPLDMGKIVTEAFGRLQTMVIESEGQIIQPETWPVAQGYAPWVEEVWVNFLSNALKYGGQPLQLGADELPTGQVRFWVKDNGVGLSPADQVRVFKPFERLQRNQEGHGLGLSIARRIVEKLGGEVGVESTVGEGSTFYFTLPATP